MDSAEETKPDEVLLSPYTNKPIKPPEERPIFWCETCAMRITLARQVVQHLDGKQHKKKLDGLKRSLCNDPEKLDPAAKKAKMHSATDVTTDAVPSAAKKTTAASKEDPASIITCDDCDVKFNHIGNAVAHFKGKKHTSVIARKALKKKEDQMQTSGRGGANNSGSRGTNAHGRGGTNDYGRGGGARGRGRGGPNVRGGVNERGRGGANERGRGAGLSRGRGGRGRADNVSYGRGAANCGNGPGYQQGGQRGGPNQMNRGGQRGRGFRGMGRNDYGGVPVGGQFANYQPEFDANNPNCTPLGAPHGAPFGAPSGRMDNNSSMLQQFRSGSMNRRELISSLLAEEERELMNTNKFSANSYDSGPSKYNQFDNIVPQNKHESLFLKHERDLSGNSDGNDDFSANHKPFNVGFRGNSGNYHDPYRSKTNDNDFDSNYDGPGATSGFDHYQY